MAQHQAAGFSPSTNDNIIKNFKNANDDLQFSKKRKHQQINPVVVNGVVRDEYADLLENKEYTPEKIAEWQAQALEWIEKAGGAAQMPDLIKAICVDLSFNAGGNQLAKYKNFIKAVKAEDYRRAALELLDSRDFNSNINNRNTRGVAIRRRGAAIELTELAEKIIMESD